MNHETKLRLGGILLWIGGLLIGLSLHDTILPPPKQTQPAASSITIATVDKCAYLIYKDCIIHRADCTNHVQETTFNLQSK